MGTTSTYNTASTRREKTTTTPISQLHEQLPARALGTIASLSTHPLVSVAAAAYVLALLYLPSNLLSPVSLITTLLFLVALLHLGSSSPTRPQQQEDNNDQQRLPPPCPPCAAEPATAVPKASTSALLGFQQKPGFFPERYHFVGWARRGPLEVIYEEYEGELDDEDVDEDSPACSQSPRRRLGLLEGIDSLVICCYTDDSSDDEDSGSDSPAWDSQEDLCFMWEEEDEGLIEIALDEDNLIEIDISACR